MMYTKNNVNIMSFLCGMFNFCPLVSALHCWAGWQTGPYTYIIVSAQTDSIDHNEPQFCIVRKTLLKIEGQSYIRKRNFSRECFALLCLGAKLTKITTKFIPAFIYSFFAEKILWYL